MIFDSGETFLDSEGVDTKDPLLRKHDGHYHWSVQTLKQISINVKSETAKLDTL